MPRVSGNVCRRRRGGVGARGELPWWNAWRVAVVILPVGLVRRLFTVDTREFLRAYFDVVWVDSVEKNCVGGLCVRLLGG